MEVYVILSNLEGSSYVWVNYSRSYINMKSLSFSINEQLTYNN